MLPVHLILYPLTTQNQVHKSAGAIHFISIGSAAARFLNQNIQSLPFDSFTIIDQAIPDEFQKGIKFIAYQPSSFGMSMDFAKRKMSDELKEFIKGIEGQVICYCALGGKTGTGLTQSFASYFKEIHHPSRLKFVTTRPPSMRLWFSTDNAEEYRKKIVAEESMIHNTEVAVLYLAKSFNQRSLPYTELYKEVPKEMMDMDMFDLGDWWVRKTIIEFLFPPSL